MALYPRLMGIEEPRIPVHAFQAVAAEWARGNITGAQANAAIAKASERFPGDPDAPLDAGEVTEAQTLVNTVPTGSTADAKASRALRLLEIDQIMLMVSAQLAPYDTEAAIKTRLGV